ncbi:MAG: hypothetical protein JOZ56_04825 [Actinobacteria bacterium]|nr:hypothetical protein [Actinomycetota bacterium]
MPQRLLDEIERRASERVPIAEINRRVGRAAAEMRLHKPSYQQVRVLVHEARGIRRPTAGSIATVALEVAYVPSRAFRLLEHAGDGPRPRLRDRAANHK